MNPPPLAPLPTHPTHRARLDLAAEQAAAAAQADHLAALRAYLAGPKFEGSDPLAPYVNVADVLLRLEETRRAADDARTAVYLAARAPDCSGSGTSIPESLRHTRYDTTTGADVRRALCQTCGRTLREEAAAPGSRVPVYPRHTASAETDAARAAALPHLAACPDDDGYPLAYDRTGYRVRVRYPWHDEEAAA